MPLFQPWYTRLGDAFDGSDVKTAEGDKDDNLDDDEDENEIIALIEMNPIMKKGLFLLLIFSQWMAKIDFRSKRFTSNSYHRHSRTVCVWPGFASGSSVAVLPAVERLLCTGLYSARRGEGEVVASRPGK